MAISSSTTVAVMTVALLLAASGLVESQSTCASKLIPCAEYLNSTKPSSACCGAMKTVVTDTDQLSCLCRLLRSPDALNGINLTQALELPKYCNLTSDTSACNGAQAPPGSSSLPPPAPPGSNAKNSASIISGMGISALLLASTFTFF